MNFDNLNLLLLIDAHCFFRYHLKDVIVGKIYFLLVRIKIKHMEIAIIKRENTGSGRFSLNFYFWQLIKYTLGVIHK